MLLIKEENSIIYVSLNRPEVRNAFHPEMIAQITKAFQEISPRKDLIAVVLRGEGKVFCAGGDLNWMKEMVRYSAKENQEDSHRLFEMFEAIWNCTLPVIGCVQGAAYGGGLGLIAVCDYVLVEEKTQMCFSEVKLGIAPAVISCFVLKKCIQGVALPLMLSAKVFSPQEVLGSGLIHEVVVESKMQVHLERALALFEEAGPEAVRESKKLIRQMSSLSDVEAKKTAAKVIAQRRVSAEGQEGLKSFLEKRKPDWKKN